MVNPQSMNIISRDSSEKYIVKYSRSNTENLNKKIWRLTSNGTQWSHVHDNVFIFTMKNIFYFINSWLKMSEKIHDKSRSDS